MARRTVDAQSVEVEIGRLADLDLAALRDRWHQLYGNPPPKSLRKAFLIKAVAYGIQAKAFGGLKPATRRRLREIAEAARTGAAIPSSSSRRIKPGVRLVRAWKNQTHVVTVLADGSFEWDGARHRSLSAIAKAITGTSWSGLSFFGIKKRAPGRAAREAEEVAAEPSPAPTAADGDNRAVRRRSARKVTPATAAATTAPLAASESRSEMSTRG